MIGRKSSSVITKNEATALKQHIIIWRLFWTGGASPCNRILLFLLSSLLLFSCSTPPAPATPQVVSVYSTAAAEPWLPPLYDCAGTSTVISRVDDSSSADIMLRIGEPEFLILPAYKIDQEEIWAVTHRESPIPTMNLQEVQALFAGQGDPSIQVWVYASGEDVQDVFDQFVMKGRRIVSSANVATNPQQMLNVLDSERQAIGILPLTWSMKMTGSTGVYHVATVPVLALTNSEPQGVIKELIACLQK
jgi:hypothetical protein